MMATQTLDTELMLDVGQANELKLAARRAGATNTDLKRLSEGDTFAKVLPVIRGLGEVTIVKRMIDLDKAPLIPFGGATVEEHKAGGQFEWDPKKVQLFLSKDQQNGKTIEGNELRKELANNPVFNANLLDYLLEHLALIPEEWKVDEQGNTRYIFFWGTIYRDSGGDLCVRGLCFREGYWQAGSGWLDRGWRSDDSAVLLAS